VTGFRAKPRRQTQVKSRTLAHASGASCVLAQQAPAEARRRLDIGTLIVRPAGVWPALALKGSRRKKTRFTPGLKKASESALLLGLGTSRHLPPAIGTSPTASGVCGLPVFVQAIQRPSEEMLKLVAQMTIRRMRRVLTSMVFTSLPSPKAIRWEAQKTSVVMERER
jgi:hypothetical protein